MRKGFTLVETLVAIALFTILVSIAAGGFTNALHTQRQIAALIAAQSNAGLALEQVAREVRTGYLFCHDVPIPPDTVGNMTCNCTVSGSVWTCSDLNFMNSDGANVVYTTSATGALTKSEDGGVVAPITGDNVVLKYLTFTLFGNIEGDHWTPRITISMGVSPNTNDPALSSNVLDLQTTVSARSIDCGPLVGC